MGRKDTDTLLKSQIIRNDDSDGDGPDSLLFNSNELNSVFATLESKGIICRTNWQCCQSCGHGCIQSELEYEEQGYIFYHIQDAEAAHKNRSIYLSHSDNETAQIVVDEFKAAGFDVDWNGSEKTRILVKGL